MNFINELTDNTLLIVPNASKEKVLKALNKKEHLVNVKIYSMMELKKHLLFDYDEDAILYLMDTYHYKYEVSKTFIDNMYYVDEVEEYTSPKLNFLKSLKKELIANNLLKYDVLFPLFIKNKNIVVVSSYLDSFDHKLLLALPNVTIIEQDIFPNKELTVYEANSIFDEVNFVFSRIARLIENGIDINKIKITNIDDSYNHTLKTLAAFYHLPLFIKDTSILTSSHVVKRFINILEESKSLDDVITTYEQIDDKSEYSIYNQIINICNKYVGLSFSYPSIKEALIYSLKNIKNDAKHFEKQLEIVPFMEYEFDEDEYVFVMSFNQGNSPIIYQDEDYISDNLKKELLLDTTDVKNTYIKKAYINKLNSINNINISYKLKSIADVFYPANLIKELNMKVNVIERDTSYSFEYSKITLGNMLDELIKYDTMNPQLNKYYSSTTIPYMTYDNKFTGINVNSLMRKLNNKLTLSYTSLDNYYRCAFRYYISNILKLNKYEETFQTFIGNLFHYILSQALKDDFSFDDEWNNYLKDKDLLVNEQFFLIKLKDELKLIIEEVKRLHQETGLTNYMLEQRIVTNQKFKNIDVDFVGIVDKIMYKEVDGKSLIAIVDYKTGNPNTNLFNVIYGIDMQLPVYLYLVKYSTLFGNPNFVGFYLQKILHGEITRNIKKTYQEQKRDNLKLYGYSTTDVNNLARFDPGYENSDFIKSMKTTSNGFSYYAKVIEDEKISLLIDLVNEKINDAIKDILNAHFVINPKRIGQDLVGCQFCKYKDLCYMKEEDVVNLKEYKDFSFLGGENNA